MTQTALAKAKAKRARRPIYLLVDRLMDPKTGELVGCLRPANEIDQRLLKERKFHMGREVRAELKQPREVWKHKLIHKIGQLLVDEVEEFRDLDSHEAIKQIQRASGVCCETVQMNASPVVTALLNAAEVLLGKGARNVLAAVLPQITVIDVSVPQSLAFDEMDNAQFEHLFKGVTQYIGDKYTHLMLDDIRAEFWQMANGEGSAA
jgi:hypothetical protein